MGTGDVTSGQFLGHFGLGLDYYTHFTSPIRRYADVVVRFHCGAVAACLLVVSDVCWLCV